jgi:hypothetical protein
VKNIRPLFVSFETDSGFFCAKREAATQKPSRFSFLRRGKVRDAVGMTAKMYEKALQRSADQPSQKRHRGKTMIGRNHAGAKNAAFPAAALPVLFDSRWCDELKPYRKQMRNDVEAAAAVVRNAVVA